VNGQDDPRAGKKNKKNKSEGVRREEGEREGRSVVEEEIVAPKINANSTSLNSRTL